jgi:hypothetical protein
MERGGGPASDVESGEESHDEGESPPPAKSRRVERQYTSDDVKKALCMILAKRHLFNEALSSAAAARAVGFSSMERHVRRLAPLPLRATRHVCAHRLHNPAHARS